MNLYAAAKWERATKRTGRFQQQQQNQRQENKAIYQSHVNFVF